MENKITLFVECEKCGRRFTQPPAAELVCKHCGWRQPVAPEDMALIADFIRRARKWDSGGVWEEHRDD